MGGGIASSSGGLLKLVRFRPQSTDLQAAAMWGVAAGTGALWLVQPFDWIKKTFFEKPKAEE